ncbi:MAG: YifB family Mg chelatase-like AAA ATPase, partial [Clostridia bacterium]
VKGQETAKKALEISAAGMHNVLMIGPPGSGKSMLASRMPSILPPITLEESIETTKIHSVAGILSKQMPLVSVRPFRAPHHSLSIAGLAGGGKTPKPGEISLSHNGILFLDEFPEFDKSATEVLRQPLEERKINITRVSGTVTYPCSFILVCAMNPCRCGYYGHPTKQCTCSPLARKSYLSRISGPLLDRIDIQLEIPALEFNELSERRLSESSAEIRKRVIAARDFASKRFENNSMANAYMQQSDLRKYCVLDDSGTQLMKKAFDKLTLSARSYDRILRVARTVADFDSSDDIKSHHLALALRLRCLDKKYFN